MLLILFRLNLLFMYMFFHPFHKAIIYLLCPFVKDRIVVSEKQYRVYGIEYIVKKGKEMQGKLVFSRWYLVFS